jgi:CMP-N-acetylneuraminic acid synthetase/spore coat polysaccharide biosynthesis predicted glycosyltransferase SpsG
MSDLLGIVPARGGSKGVRGKNLRPLKGKPLILYTLESLVQVPEIDRLVVSTESAEIASFVRVRGYEVLDRPEHLSQPESTVSEVALDAVDQLGWRGDVGVFQPTSPFRSVDSVTRAIETFRESGCDSLSSAVRTNHLYWYERNADIREAEPLFQERRNRQFADNRVLVETGSIQLIRSEALALGDLVSPKHRLFETDPSESIDIDSLVDLERARFEMESGSVVFRLRANRQIGTGHLYHSLALAEELQRHSVTFILSGCDDQIIEMVRASGWDYEIEDENLHELLSRVDPKRPRVLISDVLDSSPADVLPAKSLGFRVVCIEDLGQGTEFADWVVNALYASQVDAKTSTGPDYASLRTEFLALPEKQVKPVAKRVLITFGGSDPSHLTERVAKALAANLDCEIRVVLGPIAHRPDLPDSVAVTSTTESMASEMLEADLVVTSAGRTVYETASTGTPVVVIAQNAREATHTHLKPESGTVFLGIGSLLDEMEIVRVVRRLLDDYQLRQELSTRLRSSVDGRGTRRIADGIDRLLAEWPQ